MTLDEMEAMDAARRPPPLPIELNDDWEVIEEDDETMVVEFSPRPNTHQYDIAAGFEVVALTQGLCPNCGEPVELNREATLNTKDDTLYYDCTHEARHRFMILESY